MKAPERLHQKWLSGIKREVELKKNEWSGHFFGTIYLGGGTPSILSSSILEELLIFIKQTFSSKVGFQDLLEINLEVNPEHVSAENIEKWLQIGFTRFSIGIQSFNDKVLKTLGRSHSVELAEKALSLFKHYNLDYSADLMFGLPNQSVDLFLEDLEKLCSYSPNHLSFYGLTIEEGTLFSQWEEKQKVEFPEDYDEFYIQGVELVESKGYLRYEVSNFAKKGFESKHNQLYWNNVDYLGVGPGAHSFKAGVRIGNEKHLNKWLLQLGEFEFSSSFTEVLSEYDKVSELVWLGLRQIRGVNLSLIELEKRNLILENAKTYLESNILIFSDGFLKVNGRGWLLIDQIVVDLI